MQKEEMVDGKIAKIGVKEYRQRRARAYGAGCFHTEHPITFVFERVAYDAGEAADMELRKQIADGMR